MGLGPRKQLLAKGRPLSAGRTATGHSYRHLGRGKPRRTANLPVAPGKPVWHFS